MKSPLSLRKPYPPYIVGSVPDLSVWQSVCSPRAVADCDLVELRVDVLPEELPLEALASAQCCKPLLLTVRHASEGGARAMEEETRLATALRLLPLASAVDWEAAQLGHAQELLEAAKAAGIPLIASAHNFERTPNVCEMLRAEERARAMGADVVKFAFRLNSAEDLRCGVELLRDASGPVAVMGMGPLGPVSRLLYGQLGSLLCYGYLGDTPTAPGQWSAALCRKAFAALQPLG